MLCHWPPTQAGQSVKGQLGQISGFSIGTRHSTQTWYFLSSHFYSFRLPSPVSFLCWAQLLLAPPQRAALLSAHFTKDTNVQYFQQFRCVCFATWALHLDAATFSLKTPNATVSQHSLKITASETNSSNPTQLTQLIPTHINSCCLCPL